jgi:uncharacterized protein YycO
MDTSITVGDIFLTHNTDEVGNDSPGYWNHAAMYIGGDIVIEAQDTTGVITVRLEDFKRRYPEWIRMRCKDKGAAQRAADAAYTFVGSAYHKMASIFLRFRRKSKGENCVSVVRKAYKEATGHDPGWKIPDHIFKSRWFRIVERHKDYDNWQMPEDFIGDRYE